METVAVLEDDGLLTPEVGEWGEDKYRLIGLYAGMFAKATRKTWQTRVYIDLFAGPGRARLQASHRVVPGSPLVALEVEPPFESFIFCDLDPMKLDVLRRRVEASHPGRNVTYLAGNANAIVAQVLGAIPAANRQRTVLGLCVIDPFGMNSLHFAAVRDLASRYMDFLVLVPTGMDANRFWAEYEKPENDIVENFLGLASWRAAWARPEVRRRGLGKFVLDKFNEQMGTLRYNVGDTKLVRAHDNNRPLYHLVLYSRSGLGLKLSRQAVKYSDPQRSFGFEDLGE